MDLQTLWRVPTRTQELAEAACWRWRYWSRAVVTMCGCEHSGTTLAYRILSAHPAVFGPPREGTTFLGGTVHWDRLKVLRKEFKASGKPVLLEKTPHHIRYMDLIRRTIPGIKFIIVLRDGRDVAASVGQRFGGNFMRGVKGWTNAGRIAALESESEDVMHIRYEDLVDEPAQCARRLCEFIGLSFDPAMLEFHRTPLPWLGYDGCQKGDGTQGPEHRKLRSWQINQPIFDGRGRWKKELPPEILKQFSRPPTADLMRRFGYY